MLAWRGRGTDFLCPDTAPDHAARFTYEYRDAGEPNHVRVGGRTGNLADRLCWEDGGNKTLVGRAGIVTVDGKDGLEVKKARDERGEFLVE